jgi:multiple sugar transport system substrate-binding protein
MKKVLLWLAAFGLGLAGCSSLSFTRQAPVVQTAPTATSVVKPASTATPTLAITPSAEGPLRLRIWVPPQFDPAADTPAGRLLEKRLDEFAARRPNVLVEARVKAEAGDGGLYEALAATSGAAQLAIPDLVALPYDMLRSAGLKGLVRPLNGLTNAMDDTDWYEFARKLAHIQDNIYGLPFAGDALVQVYRPSKVASPPGDWTTALQLDSSLAFAAGDPAALFTLMQYQAAEGAITDNQGRAFLDADRLAEVLTFYQEAEKSGLMPYWLTQLQSDEQAWQAFQEGKADLAGVWASDYLNALPEDSAMAGLPTRGGELSSLATGWLWALASNDPARHDLAIELAEFLTESSFLAQWTQAAGYLPTRPSVLEGWKDGEIKTVLSLIASAAIPPPPVDLLSSLGPALQNAALQVLKGLSDPEAAAQEAARSLVTP